MNFILQPWQILFVTFCGFVNQRQTEIIDFQNAQIQALMDKLGNVIGPMPTTLAGQMYIDAISVAVWVIVSYIGCREAGKLVGKSNGDGILGKVKKTGLLGKFFK